MAVGISSFAANALFDAIGNNTSFAVATCYIKLHVGDPGAAGAGNAATETTRKAVSFGAAASGAIASDAAVTWTNVAGTEDYTHFSLWDASSGGNFLGSGTITAAAVTAGDTFTIASGDLDLSLTVAS
jgi:hypothetical protein